MAATDTPVRVVLGSTLAREIDYPEETFLHLDRPSPAEAIRAIDANTKGRLRRYLTNPAAPKNYRVALSRESNGIGLDEVAYPSGRSDIYILPVIAGRNSGAGKIIAGALLIVAAFVAAPYTAGTSLSWIPGALGAAGASMVIGGITQLITPLPNFNQNSIGDSRGSDTFQGNSQTISQGGAVGLIYGRVLVTPMPISMSFTAVDQAIVNSFAPQGYTTVYGDGGIISYVPITPGAADNLPEN